MRVDGSTHLFNLVAAWVGSMALTSINQVTKNIVEAQRAVGGATDIAPVKLVGTQIYVGLNDANTRKQEHETDRYVSLLKKICVQYGVPFSFDVVHGGYVHDDGEYAEETSIVLAFIGVEQDVVDQIASDLCTFFKQESVLVTTEEIQARTVHSVFRHA